MSPPTMMTGGLSEMMSTTTKPAQEGSNSDDDDDCSRDLLLTQDEWSSGDDEEDGEEDDDAFYARKTGNNVPPAGTDTSVSPSKGALDGRQLVALSSPSNHHRRANTTAHKTPSPNTRRTSARHNDDSPSSAASNFQSPASRTLNTFSQQSQDDNLIYDMSRTERDEASVLLQLKHGTFDTSSSSPKRDDRGPVAESPLRTPNNSKDKGKDKATSSRPPNDNDASKQAAKTRAETDEQQEQSEEEVRMGSKEVAMAQPRKSNSEAPATAQNPEPSAAQPKQPACPKKPIINPYRKQTKPKSASQQQQSLPPQDRQPKHVSWKEQEQPQQARAHAKPQQSLPDNTSTSTTGRDQMTDLADYEVLHIIVPVTGSLGATITQGTPPATLMTCATKKYCWIKAVTPGSLANTSGLKGNDWLLKDAAAGGLATYNEIVTMAKSNERPLNLYVAREKPKTTPTGTPPQATMEEQDTLQIVDSEVETVINRYAADQESAPTDKGICTMLASCRINNNKNNGTNKKPSSTTTAAAKSKPKAAKATKAKPKAAKPKVAQETRKPAKSSKAPAKLKDADFLSSSDSEDEEDEHEPVKLPNGDKVVPYCKLCNTPATKKKKRSMCIHHALCPENDFFRDSNADAILRDIISGVEHGCGVCVEAYQTGKAPKKGSAHAESCPNSQRALPAAASKKKDSASNTKAPTASNRQKKGPSQTAAASSEKKGPSKTAAASNSEKEIGGPPPKRQRSGKEQVAEKGASLQSSSGLEPREGQDANASISPNTSLESNQASKGPPQSQRGTSASAGRLAGGNSSSRPESHQIAAMLPDGSDGPSVQDTNGTTASRQHKKGTQLPDSSSTKRVTTPSNGTSKSQQQPSNAPAPPRRSTTPQPQNNRAAETATVGPARRVSLSPQCPLGPTLAAAPANITPTNASKNQRHGHSTSLNQEGPEYDTSKPCRTKWIHIAPSPCGPLGFMLDDAVLITNARGIGHHEALLPSERYERNPFSDSSNYHKTHQTPREGMQLIRLQRDTMASRSWGFTVGRHEFGGACLVESVDPMSPAGSAVCVGSEIASSLRVNDMIVAIDGKEVGGMTVEGVEIALETSGPRICLAVSRYRFAEQLTDTMYEVEEQMVAAIDKAINDERNLGWVDIGSTDSSSPMISAVASKVLNNQLRSETTSINHHVPPSSAEQTRESSDHGSDDPGNSESLTREVFETNAPLGPSKEGGSSQDQASGSGRDTTVATPRTDDTEAESVDRDHGDSQSSRVDPKTTKASKKVRWQSDSEDNDGSSQTKKTRTALLSTDTRIGQSAPTGNATLDVNSDREHEHDDEGQVDHAHRHSDSTATSAASEPAEHEQTAERVSVEDEPAPEQDCPVGMDIDKDEKDESKDDGGCQDMDVSESDDDDDDDGNPALGCICGKVHGGNISVFWLQCDSCDAWYNVAKRCVKFTEAEGEAMDRWICLACCESDDDEDCSQWQQSQPSQAHRVSPTPDSDSDESDQSASPVFERRKQRKPDPPPKIDPHRELADGTMVEVLPEGSHKFGGIGKVLESKMEDGERLYTVKYTIHRYTEKGIPAAYVVDKSEEYA